MIRTADIIAILIFLLGMAGMGLYFARQNRSTEAYFLGNRAFPGWAIGLSMLGTSISSVTFLALPAAAYVLDFRMLTPNLTLPVVAVIAIFVFIPFFRRGLTVSAYEYLENRFGLGVRMYVAIYFVLNQFLRLAIILYLVSIPVAAMSGIDIVSVIIIGGAIICFYTVLGGIEAVIWTDVIQTVILLLGGIFCFAVIVSGLPGGLGEILRVGAEHNKFSLGPLDFNLSERTFGLMTLLGLVSFIGEYCGNQNVVQRYLAASSMREARKATLICAAMSVPTWGFFYFLGSCLFVYYLAFPSPAVASLSADDILPYFIATRTPPGIGGIIIAGCLAAAMSSLDSSINAISTIFTVDFVRRFRKQPDDRKDLRVAKWTALAAGLFMIIGAVGISKLPKESIMDLSLTIGAVLGGAALAPYLLGFFVRRVGYHALIAGMIAALAFNFYNSLNYLQLLPSLLGVRYHIYWTGIFANLIMFVTALVYSIFRPAPPPPPGMTVYR